MRVRILTLSTWDEIHLEYDRLWGAYPQVKTRHALASLCDLHGIAASDVTPEMWHQWLDAAAATQNEIAERTHRSRAKDFDNPFKHITFSTPEEMHAVMGSVDENSFVEQVREESKAFAARVEALKAAQA